MKIIGHRGAAGLALENTLPSIELARLLGVDAIELDVRKTKDNQLVLCHDSDLRRVAGVGHKVSEHTLKELQSIILNDGQSFIPTLHQALQTAGDTPVIIELKQKDCVTELGKVLQDFPNLDITIASFKLNGLHELREHNSSLRIYGLEHTKPFEIIQRVKRANFDGVGINFWLLNPLTYFLIRRAKLEVYAYTINNRVLVNFIRLLYPRVAVCSDRPELFVKHPWLKVRSGPQFKPLRPKNIRTRKNTRGQEISDKASTRYTKAS